MYGQELESKYKIDESGLNNSTCGKSFKILWVKVENKFKMRNAMQKKKKNQNVMKLPRKSTCLLSQKYCLSKRSWHWPGIFGILSLSHPFPH